MSLQGFIETLDEAGVEFVVSGAGTGTMAVPADELLMFLEDPQAWYAAAAGVDKAALLEWQACHGAAPQCSAMTKRGHRCRIHVAGRSHLWIDEFARKKGGFCTLHGGGAP